MQTSYEQVPLTADDRDMLLTIYERRLRLFFLVYILLVIMAARISGVTITTRNTPEMSRPIHHYGDPVAVSANQMIVINMVLLDSMLIIPGIFIFFRRIYPYRKDLKCGMKEKIPYTIIRKEYFPYVNQCYVAFDDPDYLHHQIDAATYDKVNEGDVMYVYRAVKSKYTFEENGRFSLM